MIIPASVTNEFRLLTDEVDDEAEKALQELLAQTSGLDIDQQREALHDVLPVLGDRFVSASAEVSTVAFDALMEIQEVKRPVATEIVDAPDSSRWHSLIGWGTSDRTLERGGIALMYSLLSGGLQKILTEISADTMIGNAQIQNEPMRSQRVPAAGCCAFCAMLASRFADYKSTRSAGEVVGRGMPVEATILGYRANGTAIRKSGGQAKGIKTRGAQALGERFHDDCRCKIVIVTEKNEAELRTLADGYYDSYRDSADKVNDGLTLKVTDISSEERLKNKYEWVQADGKSRNAKERTADILTAMRLDLGVK